MTFEYPSFLYALFALLIPVIIHLLNLRRVKKVFYSNVSFLEEVNASSKRKTKLQHILILLARLLFLTFLILAFSKPIILGDKKEENKNNAHVTVYLDNSMSMENIENKSSRLEEGIKFIQSLPEIYKVNTRFRLVTNGYYYGPNFTQKEYFNQKLSEVGYSYNSRDIEEVFAIASGDEENKQLFVVSDFQKNFINNLSPALDSSVKCFLIPVSNPGGNNLSIDSVWLSDPLVQIRRKNTLHLTVTNFGSKEVLDAPVKLVINGQLISSKVISLEPNTSKIEEIEFTLSQGGSQSGEVLIGDQPITFDNQFYFSFYCYEKVNVGLMSENSFSYVRNALANESIFNVIDNPETINEELDFLILDQTQLISDETWEQIEGLSIPVLYIPSKNISQEGLNSFFKSMNISGAVMAENKLDSLRDENFELQITNRNDPFFEGVFKSNKQNISMPFHKHLVKLPAGGFSLLNTKNGKPAFKKYIRNGRNIFTLSSPLKKEFTELHFNALFVPVLYKSISTSLRKNESLFQTFNQKYVILKGWFNFPVEYYRLSKGELTIKPVRKAINRLVFELPEEAVEPGVFEVKEKENTIAYLAVNMKSRESDMDFFKEGALKKIFSNEQNVKIASVSGLDNPFEKLNLVNNNRPIWKICLLLCLIFLLSEIVIIRLSK